MSAQPVNIIYMGNSITGAVAPGGTLSTAAISGAALAPLLGCAVNVGLVPWSGALGGAQTEDDQPGGSNFAAAVALASGLAAPVWYVIMLGSNDARYTLDGASLFGTHMGAIIAGLRSSVPGCRMIVDYDPYFSVPSGGSAAAQTVLLSYHPTIAGLANGTDVFLGCTSMWTLFQANPGWLYDGVHPDLANGQPGMANARAPVHASIIAPYLSYSPILPDPLFFG